MKARPSTLPSYRTDLAVTTITNLGLAATGVITGVILARLLGPEARGQLAFVQLWGALIATLALVGVDNAIVYKVSRSPSAARAIWLHAVFLLLVFAPPILAVGYWLSAPIAGRQGHGVATLLAWYLPAFFLVSVASTLSLGVIRGLGYTRAWNVLRSLPQLGWLGVVALAGFLGLRSVALILYGWLALCVVLTLPAVLFALRHTVSGASITRSPAGELLRYGFPLALAALPYWLLRGGRLAQLFVAALGSSEALGYLAVATTWGEVTGLVSDGIASVLFPRVGQEVAVEGRHLAALRLSHRVRSAAVVTVGTTLPLLVVCPWGVPLLFGEAFRPAVATAMLLVVAGALEGVRTVLNAALRGLGKPGYVLAGDVFTSAAAAALLAVFVPTGGLTGVGWAMLSAAGAGTLVTGAMVRRVLPGGSRIIPGSSDIWAVVSAGKSAVAQMQEWANRTMVGR